MAKAYIRISLTVVVYFSLNSLLYLAFSANIGLLCMLHPGMGALDQHPFQGMVE